jgi:hypothetical protein
MSVPFVHLRLIFLLLIVCGFTSAETVPKGNPTRNPALIYWQAMSLMSALSSEENTLLLDAASGKLPTHKDAIKQLLTRNETSLRLLRRATIEPTQCDWGTLFEDGPYAVMPHINGMQQLSRLALAKAEISFAEGNNSDALEWILRAHRAARHTAAGDMLVSAVVQFGIEAQCLTATGRHLLALTEQERAVHLKALKELPPLQTVAQAFGGELHYVDWAEQEFRGVKEATEAAFLMQQLKVQGAAYSTNENTPAPPETEEMRKIKGEFMQKGLPIMMKETREYYMRAQEACKKPWKVGYAELEALRMEIHDHGNYIIQQIYPSVTASRERELRLETERTMLIAALSVGTELRDGPLSGFNDAVNQNPLLVKKTQEGWVIQMIPNSENGIPIARKVPMLKLGK